MNGGIKGRGSLNRNPANNGSGKGPLRVIEGVLSYGTGLLGRDRVLFACGHEGNATRGAVRGRCGECGKEEMRR